MPQHSHDKSNSVTGRDRRGATNGESVPEAEQDDSGSSDIVCFLWHSYSSSASLYALMMVQVDIVITNLGLHTREGRAAGEDDVPPSEILGQVRGQ
jgi:hypothetical protein